MTISLLDFFCLLVGFLLFFLCPLSLNCSSSSQPHYKTGLKRPRPCRPGVAVTPGHVVLQLSRMGFIADWLVSSIIITCYHILGNETVPVCVNVSTSSSAVLTLAFLWHSVQPQDCTLGFY